jgi:hypothetical protein
VTSERKRLANRRNALRSSGPRSRKGKARSSQNALRHGLNRIHHTNPFYSEEIERLASALCEGNDDPNLREQATIIAECDLIIRTARAEEIAAIEWLRDSTAVPLSRSNASLAQARALFEEIKLIGEEQSQYPGIFFPTNVDKATFASRPQPVQLWHPREPRDEIQAVRLALPQLRRYQRYARRAGSQKKRAMLAFIAIKAGMAG